MTLTPLLAASPAIQLHVAAATAAIPLTVLLLAGPKGSRTHRLLGWSWIAVMLLAAGSGLFIHTIRLWGLWSPIHLLSLWVVLSVLLGVRAARQQRVRRHRQVMLSLVFGALLGAGALAFLPGRLMHQVAFGG